MAEVVAEGDQVSVVAQRHRISKSPLSIDNRHGRLLVYQRARAVPSHFAAMAGSIPHRRPVSTKHDSPKRREAASPHHL
jgi:hypothetical protein